jgi:hypothetical protein
VGKLIGKVIVEPAKAIPGKTVFVQVCDANGKPISDLATRVTIMGTQGSERYLQFATSGTRKVLICAVRGVESESVEVAIEVEGATAASASQMLLVKRVAGRPYAMTFTLGTPPRLRPALVRKQLKAKPEPSPRPAQASKPVSDLFGEEVAKALANALEGKVTRLAQQTVESKTGTAKHAGALGLVEVSSVPSRTTYKWDFGDGQTVTTDSPTVTHDYFQAIEAGKVAHSFHVACTAVHDNRTVKRTFVLHSAYGLCRQRGVIVPPVIGDVYAGFYDVGYSASMVVYNLEASPITLNKMAFVPTSKKPGDNLPAPRFVPMKVPVILPANSAVGLGIYIPLNELQRAGVPAADISGFTVYYSGEVQNGHQQVPVRFSYAFCISVSNAQYDAFSLPSSAAATEWDITGALRTVTAVAMDAKSAISRPGGQLLDPATRTVAILLSTHPRDVSALNRVRSAIEAGMTSIAQKAAVTAKRTLRLPPGNAREKRIEESFAPSNPPPVAVNNECYPDDISDSDEAAAKAAELVCQANRRNCVRQDTSVISKRTAGGCHPVAGTAGRRGHDRGDVQGSQSAAISWPFGDYDI